MGVAFVHPTHGACGRDKILQSIDIGESVESFWLYLALLESSDVDERKRVLLEATKEDRDDLALDLVPYFLASRT